MNVRTTIMLEKPIFDRIRQESRKNRETLTETIRRLILRGFTSKRKKNPVAPRLPKLSLGKELIDISHRARIYELWDTEK